MFLTHFIIRLGFSELCWVFTSNSSQQIFTNVHFTFGLTVKKPYISTVLIYILKCLPNRHWQIKYTWSAGGGWCACCSIKRWWTLSNVMLRISFARPAKSSPEGCSAGSSVFGVELLSASFCNVFWADGWLTALDESISIAWLTRSCKNISI